MNNLSFDNVFSLVMSHCKVSEKMLLKFDKNHKSVAEYAAEYDRLPVGFDQWDHGYYIGGRKVAHIAAEYNNLPADFDRWEIADDDGWTVAHHAAMHGSLPESFDDWNIIDNDGKTVKDIYDEFKS